MTPTVRSGSTRLVVHSRRRLQLHDRCPLGSLARFTPLRFRLTSISTPWRQRQKTRLALFLCFSVLVFISFRFRYLLISLRTLIQTSLFSSDITRVDISPQISPQKDGRMAVHQAHTIAFPQAETQNGGRRRRGLDIILEVASSHTGRWPKKKGVDFSFLTSLVSCLVNN